MEPATRRTSNAKNLEACFHAVPGEEAERILAGRPCGTFLVRYTSTEAQLAVSVVVGGGQVLHRRVRIEPRAEPTYEGFGCWLGAGADEEDNDDDDDDYEQAVVDDDDELAGAAAADEQADGPYFFVEFPDVRRASLHDLLSVWPTEYIDPLPYVEERGEMAALRDSEPMPQVASPLLSLADELLLAIFEHLPAAASCRRACVVGNEAKLWRTLYARDFGAWVPPVYLAEGGEMTWKQIHRLEHDLFYRMDTSAFVFSFPNDEYQASVMGGCYIQYSNASAGELICHSERCSLGFIEGAQSPIWRVRRGSLVGYACTPQPSAETIIYPQLSSFLREYHLSVSPARSTPSLCELRDAMLGKRHSLTLRHPEPLPLQFALLNRLLASPEGATRLEELVIRRYDTDHYLTFLADQLTRKLLNAALSHIAATDRHLRVLDIQCNLRAEAVDVLVQIIDASHDGMPTKRQSSWALIKALPRSQTLEELRIVLAPRTAQLDQAPSDLAYLQPHKLQAIFNSCSPRLRQVSIEGVADLQKRNVVEAAMSNFRSARNSLFCFSIAAPTTLSNS